jgi:hypothetical protein
MGRHEACGAPKRFGGTEKLSLVLKTLCHWLGMEIEAGADDLLSLAGGKSKTGGDEASKLGWGKSYIQLGVPVRQVGTNDLLSSGADGIVTR